MKNLMKIVLLAVLAGAVAGCDMFNVDVDSTMSTTLDIQVEDGLAKSTDSYAFSGSSTIDPMEDDQVKEYADKIVGVGVDGIIATVKSVSESDVSFLAGTVLTVSNGSKTATFTFEEDWAIEAGTTVSIDDLEGFYGDLSSILEDLDVFTVEMSGHSSKAGVLVSVALDINTVVTGSPF